MQLSQENEKILGGIAEMKLVIANLAPEKKEEKGILDNEEMEELGLSRLWC